ncbi:hypothetical protein [Micromonospora sp. NPDC049274]|uniref:hypothetical protein n=1 Tax=Micromonospora sp. NPDC049274 TaxID=3154829 RepID=UPI003416E1EA
MGQQRGEFGCACRVVMTDPGNSSDEVLGEVGDQDRVGDRPQPSPADPEGERTLVDEIAAAPAVAGEVVPR